MPRPAGRRRLAPTRVEPSPRRGGGLGLFAARPLPAGATVQRLRGEFVAAAEFDARAESAPEAQYLGFRVRRRYLVDPGAWREGRAPGDWYRMNHSLVAANVRPTFAPPATIEFVTTRPVAAGAELLYAYDNCTPEGWAE